jgi:hypothetical protein
LMVDTKAHAHNPPDRDYERSLCIQWPTKY